MKISNIYIKLNINFKKMKLNFTNKFVNKIFVVSC